MTASEIAGKAGDVEEEPNAQGNRDESVDLAGRLRGVFRGFVHYLQARHQLLSLEAGEATDWFGRQVLRWIVGGTLVLLGYMLVLAGGVALLSHWMQIAWWEVCLILAPAHLVVGLLILGSTRRWPASVLFEASRKEFEKDRIWLSKQSEDL